MGERERVTLKTAKQERTINPDTRLHSDEMRETDEKRRLARNPTEGNITGKVGGVMSRPVHREVMSGCNLQYSSTLHCPTILAKHLPLDIGG